MYEPPTTAASRCAGPRRSVRGTHLTAAELLAKQRGQTYLDLARSYWMAGDPANAVSCCLEGFEASYGISRPLAIRDQLHDLLHAIDPSEELVTQIRNSMRMAPRRSLLQLRPERHFPEHV